MGERSQYVNPIVQTSPVIGNGDGWDGCCRSESRRTRSTDEWPIPQHPIPSHGGAGRSRERPAWASTGARVGFPGFGGEEYGIIADGNALDLYVSGTAEVYTQILLYVQPVRHLMGGAAIRSGWLLTRPAPPSATPVAPASAISIASAATGCAASTATFAATTAAATRSRW